MNWIKFLFVLSILLHYSTQLYSQDIQYLAEDLTPNQEKISQQIDELSAQEISFYYDKIVGDPSSQLTGDQLLENLTRQNWNETSSIWVNDSLYTHSYNIRNLVDTLISHKWLSGSNWGYAKRTTYNYNTNNKLILKGFANYGGGWNESARHQFYYSGVNQNLSRMDYYFYSENNWVLYGYYIYSWNSNNNLSNVINYTLSTIGPWIYLATGKDEYYYDSTNVLIMKTELWSFYGHVWINDINDLYFYDQNGNNNERIRQDWNSTDSSWVNDYRYLYEYDLNDVLLSTLYQDWQQDSLDWENVWRETYTYTPQNKIATMSKETWTQGTGWNNYVLRTYFYDSNFNWTEKITQLWDESIWKNYYRHLATWLEPVSVWETLPDLESYHLSNNYPNPFNPSTRIKFKIPGQARNDNVLVTLKVYDMLGNEISTLVNEEKPAGEYEIEFDGKGLSSGMYFYTLRAGKYSETKKMILLK